MRKLISIFLSLPVLLLAQNHETSIETKSFKDFFSEGSSHGHFRDFFMTTNSFNSSKNHFANATGGAIAYRTAMFEGLQLGVKGIFTFNTFSSDLESSEGGLWEQQLFDVTRPEEKLDLDRLEELFMKFEHKKVSLQLGRFDFDSPLMNASDGRMKPYVYSGIEVLYNLSQKWTMSSRYINSVSPRSTTHFYGVGESIGIYSTGQNIEGESVDYRHQLKSDFVLVNQASFQGNKGLEFSFHNYWLDRVSLNNLICLEKSINKLELGIQFMRQENIASDLNQMYFDSQNGSNVFSFQLKNKRKKLALSSNYSTVFGGRFLFPREFGRETFYGSISRLRLEGKNNVHLWGLKEEIQIDNSKFKDLSIVSEQGLMLVSDDVSDNKYYEADLIQINFQMKYEFHKHLQGMEMELLWVNRFPLQNMSSSELGFSQINLITNINF